jgi:hypothetical protein
MQKVTEAERALLDRYAKITLAVYLDGQRINAGVGSFEHACACGSEDAFSFGNSCASSLKASLDAALPNINGQKIRIVWSVDSTEHPLFDGIIESGLISAGKTQIEAWDAMYYGGSDVFMPSWGAGQSISAAAVLTEIAAGMGVYADPEALELLNGVTIYGGSGRSVEEISYSAAAGYVAGLIGANAMISRSGQLTIRKISAVDFESEPYSGGAQAQNRDFTVTGITMLREEILTVQNEDGSAGEEESVTEYGAGDGTLLISNPMADQAAADRSFDALKGLTFRPGSYSFPGGILLEPGDLIRIHSMDGSYDVLCAMIGMAIDGGVKTTVTCGGAIQKGGAQGAINQALAILTADFARIRKLVADNAEIVSAKISNLKADDITAGRIHSTDFAAVDLPLLYPVSGEIVSELVSRSGSNIVLPDAGERALSGLTIYGKTLQSGNPLPESPVPLVSPGDGGNISVKIGASAADANAQILTVSTPNGLPGIPVLSGGNYTDANGQQWLCNEIDFARGKYIQRALKVVFDGSEDEGWVTSPTSNSATPRMMLSAYRGTIVGSANNSAKANAFCTHYSIIPPGTVGTWGCHEGCSVDVNGSIYFFDAEYTTAAAWKAFLALNPITCIFQLSTPTETDLTSGQLAAYAALRTVGAGTTVFNDADAYMTVSYVVGGEDLIYPADDLHPNNGEQIIRGFEIDFASGVIRGVFWSEESEKLAARIAAIEQNQQDIEDRLRRLEAGQT